MADIFHSTKLIKTRKKPFLYCFAFLLYISIPTYTCIPQENHHANVWLLSYDLAKVYSNYGFGSEFKMNSTDFWHGTGAGEMNEEKSIEGTSTIIWCKLRAKVFMYDHNTKNSMQFAYNIPYIMREWAKILRNSSQYEKKFICESYNLYNVHVPFCFFNTFFFVQIHFSCAKFKICRIHF